MKTFGDTRNRWGAYSGIAVDPADPTKVWLFGEYAAAPANTWGTWIGAVTSTKQPLSVTIIGAGSGTVTSSPPGISCGNVCSAAFDQGTSVTLKAETASGSRFVGWNGEGCSGTGTCTVRMTQARSVTAPFTQQFPLTVAKAGTGSGTVTSSPAGILCGSTCSAPLDADTSVTLLATAASGSTFTGWSGEGCGGTGACTVRMTQARSVIATFTVAVHRGFNGAERSDILWRHTSGALTIWFMDGTSKIGAGSLGSVSTDWQIQ